MCIFIQTTCSVSICALKGVKHYVHVILINIEILLIETNIFRKNNLCLQCTKSLIQWNCFHK